MNKTDKMDSDSENYASEDGKKRSRKDEDGEIFNKSKKIYRTPNKNISKEENKLDELIKMVQNLTTQTSEISVEIKEIKDEQREYRDEIRKLKDEMEEVKQSNLAIRKENNELKKELKYTTDRMEKLEREQKANNVVIQGLTIDTYDQEVIKEKVTNFIEQKLNINIKIEKTQKLGDKTYLVKVTSRTEKLKIMQNKKKLRLLQEDRIYINDDLTKEEMRIQREVRRKANEEKNKGKKTKVGYQKVTIDGKLWSWNKEKDMLEAVKVVISKN